MMGESDLFVVVTGRRGTGFHSVGVRLTGQSALDSLANLHAIAPTLSIHAVEIREEVTLAGTAYATTVRYTKVDWRWERSRPWKR
jgi:hypothetical protein